MESRTPAPKIGTLPNEILLQIFECGLPTFTLFTCILICKQWTNLASSVLYRHVLLTTHTLTRWTANSPQSRDSIIESFTLQINPDPSSAASFEALVAPCQLRTDLALLPSRIANMKSLRSFSLRVLRRPPPRSPPSYMWIPESLLAAIISQLPAGCSSLEIYFRDKKPISDPCHLCPIIRRLISQLRYLRLDLPSLCPEAFGEVTKSHSSPFNPMEALYLEQCVIRVFVSSIPNFVIHTEVCGSPGRNISIVLADCLQAFASSGKCPKLEQLCILDALPLEKHHASYQSSVRRDVSGKGSLVLPYTHILQSKRGENHLIRMSLDHNNGTSAGVVSTWDSVNKFAEGHVWDEAIIGARLPASILPRTSLMSAVPVARTADV